MSKVITFSRVFPKCHPKAGQPTYFVEKIYKSLFLMKCVPPELVTDFNFAIMNDENYMAKHHTIRNGSRWKVGDKFSPRVWIGKPYNSKQIILSDDVQIKSIWDFEMDLNGIYSINGKYIDEQTEYNLAMNDGLTESDMQSWFMPNYNKPKEFKGQIICWSDAVSYGFR